MKRVTAIAAMAIALLAGACTTTQQRVSGAAVGGVFGAAVAGPVGAGAGAAAGAWTAPSIDR